MAVWERVGPAALLTVSVLAGVGLLETLVRTGLIKSTFIPAPSAVLSSVPAAASGTLGPLALTLGEIGLSFALSMFLGLVLGLLMGSNRYIDSVAGGYAFLLNATPKVIFLPLLILWFGLGLRAVVVFTVFEASIPIALLAAGAVRDLDRDVVRITSSMGATWLQLQTKVILPSSAPAILASAQVGLGFCMVGVVLAQMFFGVGGVGSLLLNDAYQLRITTLYAVALLLGVITLAILLSTRYLTNRYFSRWHIRVSEAA